MRRLQLLTPLLLSLCSTGCVAVEEDVCSGPRTMLAADGSALFLDAWHAPTNVKVHTSDGKQEVALRCVVLLVCVYVLVGLRLLC